MMKRIILITALFLLGFNSNAQKERVKNRIKDKIRTYKIAYLTEELALTEQEAEKFWPIYNNYDKKMMELHREERIGVHKKIREYGGLDNVTDKQAKEIIERTHYLAEERTKVKRNFLNKIRAIIPYKKILQLEIAEHEFNRKLMRKLRGKRNKK